MLEMCFCAGFEILNSSMNFFDGRWRVGKRKALGSSVCRALETLNYKRSFRVRHTLNTQLYAINLWARNVTSCFDSFISLCCYVEPSAKTE
jgi:hypothetical protein